MHACMDPCMFTVCHQIKVAKKMLVKKKKKQEKLELFQNKKTSITLEQGCFSKSRLSSSLNLNKILIYTLA